MGAVPDSRNHDSRHGGAGLCWKRFLVPVTLGLAGVYLLHSAFDSGATIPLVGGIVLPVRFVFLLGGSSVLGAIVVTVERVIDPGQGDG
jgi:hypothetical protein